MESCIRDIKDWMIIDKLKLNDGKTELMLVGTKQQLAKVNVGGLCVGMLITSFLHPLSHGLCKSWT